MRESNHAFILSIFVKMLRKSIYSLLLNAKDVILSIYHILEVFYDSHTDRLFNPYTVDILMF